MTATHTAPITAQPTVHTGPVRRRVSRTTPEDRLVLLGCAVSSALLSWLVMYQLLDSPGRLADLIIWYVLFVAMAATITAERLGKRAAADTVATIVVVTGSGMLLAPLLALLTYVIVRGAPSLRATFFTRDQLAVLPTDPSTAGGALHAIIGTLEQTGMALVLVVPLALLTAVFLNETRSRLRRPVRIFVDAMSGLPSVVAGLFIYAALVIGGGFSGLMASLALAMVMLPTVTRTVDVVLRLVPDGLREASLALGASRARTVWSVVLPTARTGVTTAVILGIARVVGETAPLLFTSFGNTLLNGDPVTGPQESLPLFVYRYVREPSQALVDRGYTGALVLIMVILALFALARLVGRDRSRRTSRRMRATRKDSGT